MRPETPRRLLQIVGVVIAEVLLWFVPLPGWLTVLAYWALMFAVGWRWHREDHPKPPRPRKRVGPPREWID